MKRVNVQIMKESAGSIRGIDSGVTNETQTEMVYCSSHMHAPMAMVDDNVRVLVSSSL